MSHQFEYPLEIKLKAMVLYKQLSSFRAVAEELGIHRMTIGKWRAKFNDVNFIKPISLKGKIGKIDESFLKLIKEFNLLQKELKETKLQLQILRKINEITSKRSERKFLFIKKNTSLFTVSQMCRTLKVDITNYYRWLNKPVSKREEYQKLKMSEVKRVFHEHKGRYGSRRIAFELQAAGFKISQPSVCEYMKIANLKVIGTKKYIKTTNSKHPFPIAENKLIQNFKVSSYNEVWVSDITYIRMGGYCNWIYLTVIIDLYDRKIIGWSLSENMLARDTTLMAFRNAILKRPIEEDQSLIFHSDRGMQYACKEFTSELKKHPSIVQSMSRLKNFWDNAVAESFFGNLKLELINENVYKTKEQAEASIYDYIENYYNKIRRHSALNNMTIEEFHELVDGKQED